MDTAIKPLIQHFERALEVPSDVVTSAIDVLRGLVILTNTDYPYSFVSTPSILDASLPPLNPFPLHLPDVAILCHYIHHLHPTSYPRLNNLLATEDPLGRKTFSYRTYGFLPLLSYSTSLAQSNPSHPMNVVVRALNEATKHPEHSLLLRIIVTANDYMLRGDDPSVLATSEEFIRSCYQDLYRRPMDVSHLEIIYRLATSCQLVIFERTYDRDVATFNTFLLSVFYLLTALLNERAFNDFISSASSLNTTPGFTRIFHSIFGLDSFSSTSLSLN